MQLVLYAVACWMALMYSHGPRFLPNVDAIETIYLFT